MLDASAWATSDSWRVNRCSKTSSGSHIGRRVDRQDHVLRIKADKIRDGAARDNVRRDLDQLLQICARLELAADLGDAEEQLFAVNLQLWKVEDDVRDLERLGDFGARFVELARSIYRLNDQRSALKRRINAVTSSAIVEEKSYSSYG